MPPQLRHKFATTRPQNPEVSPQFPDSFLTNIQSFSCTFTVQYRWDARAREQELSTPDRVPMKEHEFPRTLPSAASSADCRPIPAKHVVTAVHGTRTVLLDSKAGRYYGLDDVGGRIWTLVRDGCTTEEIVQHLANEYDADIDTINTDVNQILSDLRSRKLVEGK